MGQANWLILPIAALLPFILGYLYFHPKVMGERLAKVTGRSLAEINENRTIGRIALIYLFSLLLAYVLTFLSVHQSAMFQLFMFDPNLADANSEYNQFINEFMTKYGHRHRTFGHGFIHGAESGLCWGLTFFGISAIMQGQPLKQIWINLVFWVLCCGIMAGIICAFI